jgi:hypothetical protein
MSCNRAVGLACLLLAAVEAPGCIRAHAKTVLEMPLDMPKPPPRVVEASDPETPQPVPLPGEPVRSNPARVRPPAPRVEAPRPPADQPKPPETTTPPAEVVKVPEEPPKPATPPATLQTTPTQREVEVERRVRTMLTQATNDLNRINYQALNADGRTQYDTAKGFVRQAEDALRAKNLPFASNLADKAAALAAQLGGR